MKTRKILALALSVTLFALPVVNALDAAFSNGDVNGDGAITATDLTGLARHVGGIEALPETGGVADKVVENVEDVDGKLVITYEDGTTLVAGTVPEPATENGFGFYELDDGTYSVYVAEEEVALQNTVTIPASYNGQAVTAVESFGLAYCQMSALVIPSTITAIGDYGFYGCENLQTVMIPITVTSIGEAAFEECTSLSYITYLGTVDQWVNIDGAWNVMQEVRCTDGTVDAQDPPATAINLASMGTPIDMNTGLAQTDSRYYPYYNSAWSTCDAAFDMDYARGWQMASEDSVGYEPTGNEDLTIWYEAGDGLMHRKTAYEDGEIWVGVLFDEAVTANCVALYWEEGSMPETYESGGFYLQYTTDGNTWRNLTDCYMESMNESGMRLDVAAFTDMEVKGMRVVVLKGSTKYAPKLQEMEMYLF